MRLVAVDAIAAWQGFTDALAHAFPSSAPVQPVNVSAVKLRKSGRYAITFNLERTVVKAPWATVQTKMHKTKGPVPYPSRRLCWHGELRLLTAFFALGNPASYGSKTKLVLSHGHYRAHDWVAKHAAVKEITPCTCAMYGVSTDPAAIMSSVGVSNGNAPKLPPAPAAKPGIVEQAWKDAIAKGTLKANDAAPVLKAKLPGKSQDITALAGIALAGTLTGPELVKLGESSGTRRDVYAAILTHYVYVDIERRITAMARDKGWEVMSGRETRPNPYCPELTVTVTTYTWAASAPFRDVLTITELRQEKAAYDAELARNLFDYLVAAAVGEARHCPSLAHNVYLAMRSDDGFEPMAPLPHSRQAAYGAAVELDPRQALPAVKVAFERGMWKGNYGGARWATIASYAAEYYSLPADMYIDRVVDLSHNSGVAFDKRVIFSLGDQAAYKRLLDAKRDGSLLTWATTDRKLLLPASFSRWLGYCRDTWCTATERWENVPWPMSDEQSADYCRTLVTACVMVELTALTREQHWLNLAERMVRDVEKSLRFWPTTRERVVDTDMPRALAHRNVIEWREQVRVAPLAWGQRTLVVHLTAEKPTAKPPVKGVKHHVIEEPEQQHSPGATALAALKAEGIAEVATGVWSGHRA